VRPAGLNLSDIATDDRVLDRRQIVMLRDLMARPANSFSRRGAQPSRNQPAKIAT